MLRRGAVIHWTVTDALQERKVLMLLGASLGDSSPIEMPPSAAGVKLAEFRAIKVLITPLTRSAAQVRWPPLAPCVTAAGSSDLQGLLLTGYWLLTAHC